jgi:hypothetical protein
LDESRKTASSAALYQSAGAAVAGSSGRIAPGMSFHRNFWKVRTWPVRIGYIEYTAIPNCPGKRPNPKASSPPATTPLLLRSKPDGIPVFDSATYR